MTTAPTLVEMPQGEAAVTPQISARRIPELDGLRGVAVLLVILSHYINSAYFLAGQRWLSYVNDVTALAWSGVDLFFILSGFLIGGILLDERSSANYFKTFYARRFFRIIPVYAAVVSAFFLCRYAEQQGWIPASLWLFGPDVPWHSYATFTQNFQWAAGGPTLNNWLTPTWSLAVEEQFYLVLPAVLWFVPRRKLVYVLGVGICAAPLLRLYLDLHFRSGPMASFCLMPCRADALLLGVAAALLVRNPLAWESLKSHRGWLAFAWFVLLAGFPIFIYLREFDPTSSFWLTTIGFSWLALFYLDLLLLALIHGAGWLGSILRSGWLMALGTISYGVYLFHKPVLGLVFSFFKMEIPVAETSSGRWLVLFALALTIAVASLSWTVFEKPLLKIGHRMKY